MPPQIEIEIEELEDTMQLSANEPVVFGRINVIDPSRRLNWDRRLYWNHYFLCVYITADAGPEPIPYYFYCLKGDGSFYWHIPPGGYMIAEFIFGNKAVPTFGAIARRGILSCFSVPETSLATYIGTLTIRAEEDRYTMRVEDHYDEALQRFKERFSEISGPVTKSLMELR